MVELTASKARAVFSKTLGPVRDGERVLLSNHDKPVAAIVSVEDLALLRAIEDRLDIDSVRAALLEPDSLAWDSVKAALGLAWLDRPTSLFDRNQAFRGRFSGETPSRIGPGSSRKLMPLRSSLSPRVARF